MLSENLWKLRKKKKLTQEQVAEQIGISRQALAKWENGESIPDVMNCSRLAEIYNVTVDNLLKFDAEQYGVPVPPKGKHMFGKIEVGENGQMKLPAKAMDIFHIEPGDKLFLLGDEKQGLAMVPEKDIQSFMRIANGEES